MVRVAFEATMEILTKTKSLLVSSRSMPLPNRISLYILIVVGYVVAILSLIFCIVALWVLVTIIFDGSLFDNPPAEEWDIR